MATKPKTTKKDGTKSNEPKVINKISFTRDQLLQFLDMSKEEAGEFIIDIARFVNDGTYPSMKDRYKARYFKSTFGDSIANQLKVHKIRVDQCLKNAENRKAEGDDGANIEDTSNETDDDDSIEAINDASVTGSDAEDLSYDYFKQLYVKEDSNKYDTKSLWDRHSDDDKRRMIDYVKTHIVDKVSVSKRDFPFAFINGNTWKHLS